MTTIEQIKDALRQKDDPQSKCLLMAIEGLEEIHGKSDDVMTASGVKAGNCLMYIKLEWERRLVK